MPDRSPRVGSVLIASDKFKGSLTSSGVGAAVRRGLLTADGELDVRVVPVADGGDGTLAAAEAAGFERVPLSATGPTGEPVHTAYARKADQAVIELAHVSGLALLPGRELAPWRATTRGTGEVIAAALDAGCRRIVLGIGGSASTDGGAGLLVGLGARLLDRVGDEISDPGAHLDQIADIDLTTMHPALGEAELLLACDVDNPLLGPRGASAVYGPQKGLAPDELPVVEANLHCWADRLDSATGTDVRLAPGAGAAGGVGYALMALGARLRPGIDLVLELVGFADQLRTARLVITGEGSLDEQTMSGKAPAGIAAASSSAGCEVVAVCGRRELDDAQLTAMGIAASYALLDVESDVQRCMTDADALLEGLGRVIAMNHL
ncbi:putative transferase [Janibacter sp. HTCC2649]|uniref:glycerate kinase n=1 Tax=Janibacter sp. HTCC2649 TaxID=313589 RepID=UPI0000670CF1|nr:glycerate kinase [Janibacter sp. HTCC2649]EAP99735.1 putative transferase [Janibacter sp. HTCC2649]